MAANRGESMRKATGRQMACLSNRTGHRVDGMTAVAATAQMSGHCTGPGTQGPCGATRVPGATVA